MWNIRIDAALGEAVAELARRDVASVVLKGPALREWYADGDTRMYIDGDLWVSPADAQTAAEVLALLGFEAGTGQDGLPDWWREHATTWARATDAVAIDLHTELQGARAEPLVVWERMLRETSDFEVGGVTAKRLNPAAAALQVTLHAAHHGADHPAGLRHVVAALAVLPPDVWPAAAALAREIDAVDGFAAGLRLVEPGDSIADSLALPATRLVETALKASTPPPTALGFEQLASASGWWKRLEIVLRKMFPPPGFIRYWWPPAAQGGGMLVVGYAYRCVWLLRRAPDGWRAWRRARREVKLGARR